MSEAFSVDELLGKLTEPHTQEMDEAQKRALLTTLAEVAEQQAALCGDTGNILVREVQTYLKSDEAATMYAFETLVQQLGDMCLDHVHGDEIENTTSSTSTMSSGGNAHEVHEHVSRQGSATSKAKSKNKKKSPTLFEYFIQRRRSQPNKKRVTTFLYP